MPDPISDTRYDVIIAGSRCAGASTALLLARAGVPLLVLHGDSWLGTTTPITVIQQEMEEFIQNVVLKKKRPRRRVRRRRSAPSPGATS